MEDQTMKNNFKYGVEYSYINNNGNSAQNDNSIFDQIKLEKLDVNLYNLMCEVQIYTVIVSNMNSAKFSKLLSVCRPILVIETRKFPNYEYIGNPKVAPQKIFNNANIEFKWFPIYFKDEKEFVKNEIFELLEKINTYVKSNKKVCVFLITRTNYHTGQVMKLIRHFILKIAPNANFDILE